MKIMIIGCMGVGAAHALAAAKLNVSKIALVDRLYDAKTKILFNKKYYNEIWTNKWGYINDSCKAPTFFNSYCCDEVWGNRNLLKEYDIFIIASPTDTHLSYLGMLLDTFSLDELKNKFILCEKPFGTNNKLLKDFSTKYKNKLQKCKNNITCGFQWRYYAIPKEITAREPVFLFSHGYSHPKDTNAFYDLGIHLLSLFENIKIKNVTNSDKIHKIEISCSSHNNINLIFGYKKVIGYKNKNKKELSGIVCFDNSILKPHIKDKSIIVYDIYNTIDDYGYNSIFGDLFTMQLKEIFEYMENKKITKETKRLNILKCLEIHNLVNECYTEKGMN